MKFLRFLSSTGGTPTTTERPLAASSGVISTRGRDDDFLLAGNGFSSSPNFLLVTLISLIPGGRTGDIGCKEEVRKVGDCVWSTEVLEEE